MPESQPLFVENRTMLLQALRLSNAPRDSDISKILDSIIQRVANGFYRKLGITRVSQIVAYSSTLSNPPTNNEIIRNIAKDTEIKWATLEVLRNLRSVWLESNSIVQEWNDETPYRSKTIEEINWELSTLSSEVEENMQLLSGSETLGFESSGFVSSPAEDDIRPLPGATLYGEWDSKRKSIIP